MGVEIVSRQIRDSSDPGGRAYYLNGSQFYRETMPRNGQIWSRTNALSSGVMHHTAIVLYAGDVVTKIGFASGATAAVSPTAWWFALYSNASTPALLAQTADQTSTAWAADTIKEVSLSSQQTITQSGVYYITLCMTAGTPISTIGFDANNGANAGLAGPTGVKRLAGTSGSALGGTAPATIASVTASRYVNYGWVL